MRYAGLALAVFVAGCEQKHAQAVDTPPVKTQAPVQVSGKRVLHASAVIPGTPYRLSYVGAGTDDYVVFDTSSSAPQLAALKVPPLARDERLFMASCDAGGKLDPYVVAIVVNQPNTTRFTQIRQAWRVNAPQARFDLIPVAGIVCEDPGG
jgi:hypothetical protein